MPTNGVARPRRILLAALTLLGVTACGSRPRPPDRRQRSRSPVRHRLDRRPHRAGRPSPTAPPQPDPVALTANVADKATKVTVDTLVKVTAKAGT